MLVVCATELIWVFITRRKKCIRLFFSLALNVMYEYWLPVISVPGISVHGNLGPQNTLELVSQKKDVKGSTRNGLSIWIVVLFCL